MQSDDHSDLPIDLASVDVGFDWPAATSILKRPTAQEIATHAAELEEYAAGIALELKIAEGVEARQWWRTERVAPMPEQRANVLSSPSLSSMPLSDAYMVLADHMLAKLGVSERDREIWAGFKRAGAPTTSGTVYAEAAYQALEDLRATIIAGDVVVTGLRLGTQSEAPGWSLARVPVPSDAFDDFQIATPNGNLVGIWNYLGDVLTFIRDDDGKQVFDSAFSRLRALTADLRGCWSEAFSDGKTQRKTAERRKTKSPLIEDAIRALYPDGVLPLGMTDAELHAQVQSHINRHLSGQGRQSITVSQSSVREHAKRVLKRNQP